MEKSNKTLNVKKTTKDVLLSVRIHPRETVDDIILRLILIYKGTEPQ